LGWCGFSVQGGNPAYQYWQAFVEKHVKPIVEEPFVIDFTV